jgi:gliding motility-associated-like protein
VAPEVNSIYRVVAYDTSGCSTGGTVNVTVKNKPDIDAGPDTFICADNPYPMNASSNNSAVNWTPTNGLSNANILNPVATIQTPTKYVLSSTDMSTNCTAYDTVLLSIRDCEDPIKVPSAFTPNGDNENDHFTVFATGMKQYSIKIFNRWGEMVYESEDVSELNDLGKGWDGKYKGKVQELGTYVYFIKGVDSDNISREKKGNLALIK